MMGVLGAASPHNHHRPPARLPRFLWEAENKRNSFSISLYYFLSVSRPESSGSSLNGSSEPAAFCIFLPVVVYSLTFKPHLLANALLEANDLILSPCMCVFVGSHGYVVSHLYGSLQSPAFPWFQLLPISGIPPGSRAAAAPLSAPAAPPGQAADISRTGHQRLTAVRRSWSCCGQQQLLTLLCFAQ